MKKVLILVLSCETRPYDKMMEASMQTWDSKIVDGVQTIFYCGKSRKPNSEKVIYLNTVDSFPTMGQKTIEAFEWAIANTSFDYLARPNSSCYVRKQKLLDYAQNLPKENLYLGLITDSCYGIKYIWGGGQYILSRDVVELIVKNKHMWNHSYTEDVSIADLLTKLGVPMNGSGNACAINKNEDGKYTCFVYGQGENMEFTNFLDMHNLQHQFFIRVKQDLKRHEDVEIMHELFKSNI